MELILTILLFTKTVVMLNLAKEGPMHQLVTQYVSALNVVCNMHLVNRVTGAMITF